MEIMCSRIITCSTQQRMALPRAILVRNGDYTFMVPPSASIASLLDMWNRKAGEG